MIDLYSGNMQVAVTVIMNEDNDSDTRHGLLETMTDNFGA